MLNKIGYVLQAFIMYLAMTAVDFASSMGPWPNGFHEANPFARHMDGSFYLKHALVNGGLEALGIGFFSAALYSISRSVNRGWTQFVASLPWIYYGWGHLQAGLDNLQVRMGLYTPSVQEILSKLLGIR